jgi:hypothetical protein
MTGIKSIFFHGEFHYLESMLFVYPHRLDCLPYNIEIILSWARNILVIRRIYFTLTRRQLPMIIDYKAMIVSISELPIMDSRAYLFLCLPAV